MKLKPKDLRKIAKMFYDLTVNKYKIYVIKENGVYDMDLSKEPEDGIDMLVERSLMAAINTIVSDYKPEILPPTKEVRLLTYNGEGKEFNPCSNDYLWGLTARKDQ